ncbi:MAG: glucosaminidase domain-containing protein [Chitinophagaceae bacterium]|nr:glucosaminidase domain-containing protein [Chitinophagaceae bacterium]
MTRKTTFLVWLCAMSVCNIAVAQNPTIIQYINTYKALAIQEMQRTGVPASIKLAQGILETQAGQSDLVMRSNNHFGIKCKTAWAGNKVYHDDDARGECFRAYSSAADSYRDHSDFLKNSQRYAFLFHINPEHYKEWAKGLKKAGYATNPQYWQQLVKYIEDYNLNLYTLVALGKRTLTNEELMYASADLQKPAIVPAVITTGNAGGASAGDAIATVPQAEPLKAKYPAGTFSINDTKVMVADAGTPLLALAEQYNIRYKHLLDFNDLSEENDIIRADQLIFLERKRKQGAVAFHTVLKGERLYDIAQGEGIRLESLMEYNRLQPGQEPMPGQKIYLQKESAQQAFDAGQQVILMNDMAQLQPGFQQNETWSSPAKPAVKHIVQSKETLYGIARKYEVEITRLRNWNNLQKDDLRVGQELLIYKN